MLLNHRHILSLRYAATRNAQIQRLRSGYSGDSWMPGTLKKPEERCRILYYDNAATVEVMRFEAVKLDINVNISGPVFDRPGR